MSARNIGIIPPLGQTSTGFSEELTRRFYLAHDANMLPVRMREKLRPILPERAFLRRVRGDGLFTTDAPRHTDTPLIPAIEAAGFLCEADRGCLTVFPDASELTGFEQRHPSPPDFFCETLLRFQGRPPSTEAIRLFALGVRLLEASGPNEIRIYERRVRSLAAVSLRQGTGGIYACALILHILNRRKEISE